MGKPAQGGEKGPGQGAPVCPLCGSAMAERAPDVLRRALGLLVVYAAALLLVAVLPSIGWGSGVATLVLAAFGCVLARGKRTWWCAACWFEAKRPPPEPENVARTPSDGPPDAPAGPPTRTEGPC